LDIPAGAENKTYMFKGKVESTESGVEATRGNERLLVKDPFLGSGQVAVVSKAMNRHYIGFEIVKNYYEFANERLEENNYILKQERHGTSLNKPLSSYLS
ncbi:hypothetical protein CW696_08175, partial [ANME-2 cluster archaeon]